MNLRKENLKNSKYGAISMTYITPDNKKLCLDGFSIF